MKYVFIAAVAAIIARGILGLINPAALNAPVPSPPPEPARPSATVIADGSPGTISGNITWAGKDEPLVGAYAIVEKTKWAAVTDAKGHYLISRMPPGTYQLVASSVGFSELRATVTLDTLTGVRVDFRLATYVIVPVRGNW